MIRDTFDMFSPPDRGRFGDNESDSVRDNESVRSDLVTLNLILRHDSRPLSIAVTQMQGAGAKWIFLPKSKIEYVAKGKGVIEVTTSDLVGEREGTDLMPRLSHPDDIGRLDRRVEIDAMQWKLLQTFLDRKVRSFITLSTVSISFNTRLEAEQFLKLMQSHRSHSK